jgi:hypothetical protein
MLDLKYLVLVDDYWWRRMHAVRIYARLVVSV